VSATLKHFPAKWEPVRRRKCDLTKSARVFSVSTETENTLAAAESVSATIRMNRIYRHQRHIYDLTRKYYLLGRDRLIDRLHPGVGDNVLEIGCGTGRNLIRAAHGYPQTRFFGIDISTEMLASAKDTIARSGLASRVMVAGADATAFNPAELFGNPRFQRVFISYSLSMIPQWRSVLRIAFSLLARNGELHVVDFGDQRALPSWLHAGLRKWLAQFSVIPCDELEFELAMHAARSNAALNVERPYRGYAQYAIVRRVE
jgi:S-adenosylmethionine-diacylgycerolhomoserine-N-methlytransferase